LTGLPQTAVPMVPRPTSSAFKHCPYLLPLFVLQLLKSRLPLPPSKGPPLFHLRFFPTVHHEKTISNFVNPPPEPSLCAALGPEFHVLSAVLSGREVFGFQYMSPRFPAIQTSSFPETHRPDCPPPSPITLDGPLGPFLSNLGSPSIFLFPKSLESLRFLLIRFVHPSAVRMSIGSSEVVGLCGCPLGTPADVSRCIYLRGAFGDFILFWLYSALLERDCKPHFSISSFPFGHKLFYFLVGFYPPFIFSLLVSTRLFSFACPRFHKLGPSAFFPASMLSLSLPLFMENQLK